LAGGALTQLVRRGEIYASPAILQRDPRAAKRGAPVGWVPMDLVVTSAGGVALPDAPRRTPDCCSPTFSSVPEGQKLYEDLFFRHRPEGLRLEALVSRKRCTLAQYEEALDGWHKLMKEITRRGPS